MSVGGEGGGFGPIEVAFIQITADSTQAEREINEVERELLALGPISDAAGREIQTSFTETGLVIVRVFDTATDAIQTDLAAINANIATSFVSGIQVARGSVESLEREFGDLRVAAAVDLSLINQGISNAFTSGSAAAQTQIRGIDQGFEALQRQSAVDLAVINANIATAFGSGSAAAQRSIFEIGGEFTQLQLRSQAQLNAINRTIAVSFASGSAAAQHSIGEIGDQFSVLAARTLSVTSLIAELFRSASNSADRSLRSIGGPDAFAGSVLSAELAARRIGNAFENASFRARIQIAGVSLAVTSLGTALTVGAGALVAFAAISTAQIEQVQIAFEGLLGSSLRAERLLEDLFDLAATTPFEVQGLAENTQRILSFSEALGVSRDQALDFLTVFGDITAALGQPIEAVDRVNRAFGQMASTGRIMTEELNQLAEALPGFPVFQVLADGLNVSTQELRRMLRDGVVPLEEGVQILVQGMREFPGAAGAMARQSQTLTGLLSTLGDTVRLELIDAFEPFVAQLRIAMREAPSVIEGFLNEVAGPLNDLATSAVQSLVSAFEALGPALGSFFTDVGSFFDTIGPSAARFGQGLLDIFTALGNALPTVGRALAPLLDTLGEMGSNTIPRVIAVFAEVVEALTPVITIISELNSFVLPILVTLLEAIPTPLLAAVVVMRQFTTVMATLRTTTLTATNSLSAFRAGISPVGIALAAATIGLSLFAQAQGAAAAEEREHEQRINSLSSAFQDATSATSAVREEIERLVDAGEDLDSVVGILDNVDAAAALDRLGLSAQQAAQLIGEGEDAVADFIVEVQDGTKETAGASGALAQLSLDFQEAAKQALQASVVTGDFTQGQVDSAIAATDAADGTNNYVAALNQLTVAEQRENAEAARQAEIREQQRAETVELTEVINTFGTQIATLQDGLGNTSAEFASFALAVDAAGLTEKQLTALSAELGISVAQLQGAIDITTDAVESFQKGIESSFPSIVGAVSELDEVTFDGLLQTFRDTFQAAVDFEKNVADLAAFPNVQAVAIQAGPQIAAALAEGFRSGRIDSLAEMDALALGNVDLFAQMQGEAAVFGTNYAAQFLENGQGTTAGWQDGLQVAAAANQETENARVNIQNAKDGFQTAGNEAGTAASDGFEEGYGTTPQTAADTTENARVNIQNSKDGFTEAGASVGVSASDGFTFGSAPIPGTAQDRMFDAQNRIRNEKDGMSSAGAETGTAASNGFAFGYGPVVGTANAFTADAVNAVRAHEAGAGSAGFSVGSAVGGGIFSGLQSWLQRIRVAAATAIDNAVNAARAEGHIQSPSLVFREIGQELGEGLVLGLEDQASSIARQAASLIDTSAASLGSLGLSAGGGNTTINLGGVTFTGAVSEQDVSRFGGVLADSVADTLARRRVRAEARIA